MNLLNVLLKIMLADSAISALSGKTGLSSAQLKKLLPLAIPLLLRFMTNNASTQSGAQSLLGALLQHTNTREIADQFHEADEADGGKIVSHILGDQQSAAVKSLALETGMSDADVTRALGGLAPALLSVLSAATTQAKPQTAAKPQTVKPAQTITLKPAQAQAQAAQAQAVDLTSLLSLLGGAAAQAQPQVQAQPAGVDLLSALLGTSTAAPAAPAATQVNPLGGLLGSLLGATPTANDNALNGNLLLNLLTALL